jgi:hypothetical protein
MQRQAHTDYPNLSNDVMSSDRRVIWAAKTLLVSARISIATSNLKLEACQHIRKLQLHITLYYIVITYVVPIIQVQNKGRTPCHCSHVDPAAGKVRT